MPGLGTSFGRGGATDFQQDLLRSDCITIMGSNMAENHPVGFQWVMEARERGAEVIHIDPRFTRTSAMATKHIGLRAGSDIAFLGGVVHYILEHERWFDEYVKTYTNARVIVGDEFSDTEDGDGFFSGWDPETRSYDVEHVAVQGDGAARRRRGARGRIRGRRASSPGTAATAAASRTGEPPEEDWTLQHPRCVFQILKRHYARYTPELVAETCGCSVEEFLWYCETICANSGRERTGAFCYAVGWTQHTVGVQLIRTAAIIQLLLGNIGRPGGGIIALRGHASIQGSTDIPTLYNILPGYLTMPHTEHYGGLEGYIERDDSARAAGGARQTPTSSRCSRRGGARPRRRRTTSASSTCRGSTTTTRTTGRSSRCSRARSRDTSSPARTPRSGRRTDARSGSGSRSSTGSSSATSSRSRPPSFWYDSPEIESGELVTEQIPTEVFFLPAASHLEKDGSFTNTQRLLQWHYKAVEPKEDCRSELWFYYHLGKQLKERLAESDDPKDRPLLDLTWDYPSRARSRSRAPRRCSARSTAGTRTESRSPRYKALKADGSTSCGCWIYCGFYAEGENQAARRKPHWEQEYTALEWAWAWPANRRLLYNRASADPDGKPWSERKKLVWWDEGERQVDRASTCPTSTSEKPPDYVPPDGARGPDAIAGTHPFIMQADGLRLAVRPAGPRGRPAPDALRAARVAVREPALRPAREPAPPAARGHGGGSVQPAPGLRASSRTSSRRTG